MKKIASILLALVISVGLLTGCGAKSEDSGYYLQSEKAVFAIEDAIYLLDKCLEEKISAEECAYGLVGIADKYDRDAEDDFVLGLALLNLRNAASGIRSAAIGQKLGTDSMLGIRREVQAARDELAEMLR